MSKGVRVICPDCGDTVEHSCHSNVQRAARDLLAWVPEYGLATEGLQREFEAAGRACQWIDEGEKVEDRFKRPFFGSQSWSYPLFGSKDEARTFHALIDNLIRATGIDPEVLKAEIYTQQRAKEQADADRKSGVQKRRDARVRVTAFLKNKKNPLKDRIAKLDELLRAKAISGKLQPYSKENGFSELYNFLDAWYDGGISSSVNRGRISKLESEMYEALRSNR